MSCHRAVQPTVRYPPVSACQCAAELRSPKRFSHGNQNRHVFRFATGHDTVYSNVPYQSITVCHRQNRNRFIPAHISVFKEL